MNALDRYGNTVRGFDVIITTPERKANIAYRNLNGWDALKLMQSFVGKRETLARTESEYAVEYLTLDEMRDIYTRI